MLINPEDNRTKTDKLKEAGVRRSTFYDWMKNENFLAYMNSQIDKYTDGELAEIWKALLRKCRLGDTAAIKLYFELKGKYRTSIDVNTNVPNPYEGLTREQLLQLARENSG